MRAFRSVVAGAVAAALTVGCVTVEVHRVIRGSYPNYREMAVAQMDLAPYYEGVPRDLVHRINIFAADVALRHYTPAEMERLDKYARGELHLSDEEVDEIHSDAEDRAGGVKKAYEEAKQKCPDVFRDAEAYRKANS